MISKLTGGVMTVITAIVAATLISTTAGADPANGEVLARRWCATCHVVAPDQTRANADVKPFAAIARSPDFNRDKLAFFLLDPHPKMPSLTLTRREAIDLADYIGSLAKP